jgi:hypothetical protein
MPLTGEMLNAQGNATCRKEAPSISPEYASVGSQTEVVPEESTAPARIIKKTAHGLNTGDLIVFTEINGKTTLGEAVGGLIIGAPYYVRKVSTSEIEVAVTKAQAESATVGEHVEFTVTIKATSKIMKLTEGNVVARIKTTFAAAANLANEDATAREIEAAGAITVDWLMYFSAVTAGTCTLVEKVTQKVLATNDLYKVTKSNVSQTGYIV